LCSTATRLSCALLAEPGQHLDHCSLCVCAPYLLPTQAVSKVEKQMGSAQSGPIISLLDACPPSGFWPKLHRISKDAAAGAERSLKQVGGQSLALYGLGAEELGQGAEYWPRVLWTSLALQQLLHRACCNAQPSLLEEVNTDRPPEVAPDTACNHPSIHPCSCWRGTT
jgi:hypothetical protein